MQLLPKKLSKVLMAWESIEARQGTGSPKDLMIKRLQVT